MCDGALKWRLLFFLREEDTNGLNFMAGSVIKILTLLGNTHLNCLEHIVYMQVYTLVNIC